MADCRSCKESRKTVPLYEHEAAMARAERHIRRLIIALIVAILAIVAVNVAWLIAWTQYDYSSEDTKEVYTYQQDGNGVNIVGSGNEVENGAKDH